MFHEQFRTKLWFVTCLLMARAFLFLSTVYVALKKYGNSIKNTL